MSAWVTKNWVILRVLKTKQFWNPKSENIIWVVNQSGVPKNSIMILKGI